MSGSVVGGIRARLAMEGQGEASLVEFWSPGRVLPNVERRLSRIAWCILYCTGRPRDEVRGWVVCGW